MSPAYPPLLRSSYSVRTRAAALLCLAAGLAAGCAAPPPRKVITPPPTPRVVSTPAPVPVATPPPELPARPVVQRFEIGRSVRGTPLVLEVFGDGPERIFIFGGIHGNEPTSAALARRLSAHLRENPDAGAGCTIGILAEANPDGLAAGTRDNASGVDLNRNFPARNWRAGRGARGPHGATPGSEPETQAILRAFDYLRPSRSMAIHSIGRGRHCNNYDGPAAPLAQRLARHNGYPARATMGYDTPGSFGSWAGVDRNVPTITLELPRDATAADCWRDNRAALLEFIRTTTTAAE